MKHEQHQERVRDQRRHAYRANRALVPRADPALRDEIAAVQRAPGHERPVRAVPESAEEHRKHQVPVRTPRAAAISSEGDVEVIAQPAGKRDVPARPEFAEAAREVRPVEVDAEVEAEDARTIGPATSSGKKTTNVVNFSRSRSAFSARR